MDLFGSDSDGDSDPWIGALASQLCVVVLRASPPHKQYRCKIAGIALGGDDGAAAVWTLVTERLAGSYDLEFAEAAAPTSRRFDAVIVLPSKAATAASSVCERLVAPGGMVLLAAAADAAPAWAGAWSCQTWLEQPYSSGGVVALRRVSCEANAEAGSSEVDAAAERLLLEAITVRRCVAEVKSGTLSAQSRSAAVEAMRTSGVCVIPSYFAPALIRGGGCAAVRDTLDCARRLSAEKAIELLPRPAADADFARFAAADEQFVRGHGDKFTLRSGPHLSGFATEHGEALRHDPSLVAVLEEVGLPVLTAAEREERKEQTMLRRSASLLESHGLGAVVALPGRGKTVDQRLHVDTEHLYEHQHLPPHYMVMFLPALASEEEERDMEVGQTAFIVGTHRTQAALERAAGGEAAAHASRYKYPRHAAPGAAAASGAADGLAAAVRPQLCNVVRPHCRAGDVVLFDARILHFGIANSSHSVHRPLLFVNYTRPWFSDFQGGSEIIVRHR